MATHAELAAKLLRNAAQFFRDVGEQNDAIKDQMEVNARTYDTVAELVERDPDGDIDLPAEEPS